MLSFLPLINSSVTTRSSFFLLSVSAIISSKTINIFLFLCGLYSSIFLNISSKSFEYSRKALKSLKCSFLSSFFNCFIVLLQIISSFSLDLCLMFLQMFLSNQLIAFFYYHLNLKAILLISLVKTLYISLLNLCCVFHINLLFFMISCMIFFKNV